MPPVALTIAGSDNSAGAGIQADLKVFSAYGVYGLTAVTCVVAEVPGLVSIIQALKPDMVREQVQLSLAAFPVAAVKTGMLYSRSIIEVVAGMAPWLPPLVIDPVMVASSGAALLEPDAIALYCEELFPGAALVTPNLAEASALLGGRTITDVPAMRAAGAELVARHRAAFLIKGGHLGGEEAVDVLCLPDGEVHEYRAAFTRGVSTHGTGCAYSAAITAGLALGLQLPAAVSRAKRYITDAVAQSFRWEGGRGTVEALNHWPAF